LAQRGFDITAVLVDLGQKTEDQTAIRDKALRSGALDCRRIDVRDEFVRDFVFPALWANALYEGRYHLGTALARPLISKVIVSVCDERDSRQ
jgi:argininosuccinate synthase